MVWLWSWAEQPSGIEILEVAFSLRGKCEPFLHSICVMSGLGENTRCSVAESR